MALDLSKYGVGEGQLDIKWRLLISCLKCESQNYQPMMLEIDRYEFFDGDEGKKAYEEFERGIPNEEDSTVTQYTFWHDDEFSLGGYETLNTFQEELEELSLLIERDGFGFSPVGDAGIAMSHSSRGYFDHPEAFELTFENSATLLKLLQAIAFQGAFWSVAENSMQSTLEKNLCNHVWISNTQEFYCENCQQRSLLEEEPKIGRGKWIEKTKARAALEVYEEPFTDDVARDMEKLQELANAGSGQAAKLIGVNYARASENALAADWYIKAISLGNLDAVSNLGVLRFIEDDYAEALELLIQASNRGNAMAMRNLGKAYDGLGKEGLSLIWFSRAAHFGEGLAALVAAEGYQKLNKLQEAIEMLRIAADLGHEEARIRLGELEFDLPER